MVILPDHDTPGREHAWNVACALDGVAAEVRIVVLPGLEEKGDVIDWLGLGHGVDEMLVLADGTPALELHSESDDGEATPGDDRHAVPGDGTRPKVATRLLTLAKGSGAKFFRDSDSAEYYVAPKGDGTQVWRLESQEAARWLTRLWLDAEGSPASPDNIKAALFTLAALVDDRDSIPLAVRVAWREGVLWYDLGASAVRVAGDGWSIVEKPPILFKRFAHQLPQIRPSVEGDFSRIEKYLPVKPDSDEALVLKTWLLTAISPDGPRPMLDKAGPQGSGKSRVSKLAKRILDPSRVPTIRRLADLRDLQQLAQTWAVFADNLSGMGAETSDLLAAAITGDATLHRKLFTDEDAKLFAYRRVVALNGISHTAERPDLLDRTILITLPRITPEKRLPEATFWQRFEADLPSILGGAFSVLSKAVALLPGGHDSIPATDGRLCEVGLCRCRSSRLGWFHVLGGLRAQCRPTA